VVPYLLVAILGILVYDAFAGRASQLAWAMVVAGGIAGFYSLMQVTGIDPLVWDGATTGTASLRVASTLGNSNFAGAYFAIAIPLGVALFVTDDNRRILAGVLTSLMAAGLLFSFSQGGWLASIAGLAVTAGLLSKAKWKSAPIAGVGLAVLIVLAAVGSVVFSMTRPAGDNPFGATVEQRANTWQSALSMAQAYPALGRGPNSFALETAQYKPEGLSIQGLQTLDDPHSVPLSMLTAAGPLGLFGFFALLVIFLRRGLRSPSTPQVTALHAAFLGAGVAYFVQSLLSHDELTMRVGLWVAVAGLWIVTEQDRPAGLAPPSQRRRSLMKTTLACTGLVALPVIGIGTASSVLRSDIEVRNGFLAAQDNDAERAVDHFERALEERDDYEYRYLYGTKVGELATRRGADGAEYFDKMNRAFSYLDDVPDADGLVSQARLTYAWGVKVDRSVLDDALTLYERAMSIDKNHPVLAAETSDVLGEMGRDEEALVLLLPFAAAKPPYAAYWGALALVNARLGHVTEAEQALSVAMDLNPEDFRSERAREELKS
jgi:O-antigen ligase/Flp pilus assembly protein TadD